jgi:hypothetical protein
MAADVTVNLVQLKANGGSSCAVRPLPSLAPVALIAHIAKNAMCLGGEIHGTSQRLCIAKRYGVNGVLVPTLETFSAKAPVSSFVKVICQYDRSPLSVLLRLFLLETIQEYGTANASLRSMQDNIK